jgi:hypothetical protein
MVLAGGYTPVVLLAVGVLADKMEHLLPVAFMVAAVQAVPLSLRAVAAEDSAGHSWPSSPELRILLLSVQGVRLLD